MFQRGENSNGPLSGFEDTAWGVELLYFSIRKKPEGDQVTLLDSAEARSLFVFGEKRTARLKPSLDILTSSPSSFQREDLGRFSCPPREVVTLGGN